MPRKKQRPPGEVRRAAEVVQPRKGAVAALYVALRLAVLAVLVAQFLNGNFENVFLCLLTLVLFLVPSFIERKIHVDLPDTLEVIILLFIFAAEILGEIQAYYIMFPYWDTMLHTLNGFLCAAIGFALVDILNRSERFSITLSPLFLAITAFCFSMTIGVLWEFFEFAMDQLFWLDMQKDTVVHAIGSVMLDPAGGQPPHRHHSTSPTSLWSPPTAPARPGAGRLSGYRHLDTMKDLFVNFIGRWYFPPSAFLCEKTGARALCPAVYPHASCRSDGRNSGITFTWYISPCGGCA